MDAVRHCRALMLGASFVVLLSACQTVNKQAYTAALDSETGVETVAAVEEEEQVRQAQFERNEQYRAETNIYFDRFETETLEPDRRPTDKSSLEAGIWLMADKSEQQLKTSGNLIPDPALQDYVRGIVCRIAQDYCGDFRVYVTRVPAFNAMMAPNGVMIVWSGLLLRAENEAQLASVIGHEIGHYLRRHSLQRHKDMIERADGMLVFSMAMGVVGLPSLADLANMMAVLGQFSFSREHEREADGYGAVLMSKAGYDASEAPKIWSNFQSELKVLGADSGPSAYSTHPPKEERIEALQYLASRIETELEQPGTGIYRDRYLDSLWQQRRSFMRDEIQIGSYAVANVLLDRMIANNDDPAAAHYFKGEIYRLGGLDSTFGPDDPAKNEFDKLEDDEKTERSLIAAHDAYLLATRAAALPGARPLPQGVHRSNGVVLRKLGRPAEAAQAFQTYLEMAPDASDAALIEMMIQELSQS